jgi:hypothetical protein
MTGVSIAILHKAAEIPAHPIGRPPTPPNRFFPWKVPRPDSSVVERGPEKAGVGGSIPSLATTLKFQQIQERPNLLKISRLALR